MGLPQSHVRYGVFDRVKKDFAGQGNVTGLLVCADNIGMNLVTEPGSTTVTAGK